MQTNRRYPDGCNLTDHEKRCAEEAFSQWLGQEWLNREKGKHPLQQLWRRLDHVAAIEVFTIGEAVRKLRSANTDDWFVKSSKAVKTNADQCSDLFFELVLASASKNDRHQAELAPYNEPGFDILVHVDDTKGIRVSCKNIGISNSEHMFRKAAKGLHRVVQEAAKEARLNAVICLAKFTDPSILPNNENAYHRLVRSSILERQLREPVMLGDEKCQILLNRLDSDRNDVELSPAYLSHNVMIVTKFDQTNEQKRFHNRFKEAASKLKRHCAPTALRANVVALRLPESISTDRAQEWLTSSFAQVYSSVSAVLLPDPKKSMMDRMSFPPDVEYSRS